MSVKVENKVMYRIRMEKDDRKSVQEDIKVIKKNDKRNKLKRNVGEIIRSAINLYKLSSLESEFLKNNNDTTIERDNIRSLGGKKVYGD